MKKKILQREDGKNYLIRWNLFECKWFSIKIHKILISDQDCHHDHPWSFITFILRGGYVEHSDKGSRIYHPGNILYRKATYRHKLEIHQPAVTFVITFKKVRQWGFWTKNGFVPWFRYNMSNRCD